MKGEDRAEKRRRKRKDTLMLSDVGCRRVGASGGSVSRLRDYG